MKQMKHYIPLKKSLAFYNVQADENFWNDHWKKQNIAQNIKKHTNEGMFLPFIKKYLPENSIILEGGCGHGYIVHALYCNKFNPIGIDFSANTIETIKKAAPYLDVRIGDVRNLPLKQNSVDGYVSGGVIEHFWDGYIPIISEMFRVLKKDGYVFITFPYMSMLRLIKAKLFFYSQIEPAQAEKYVSSFYQFALNHKQVIKSFEEFGFKLLEQKPLDGIKGFKDEVKPFKPFLQKIYDGKTHQKHKSRIDRFLRPFAGHIIFMVFQKK